MRQRFAGLGVVVHSGRKFARGQGQEGGGKFSMPQGVTRGKLKGAVLSQV